MYLGATQTAWQQQQQQSAADAGILGSTWEPQNLIHANAAVSVFRAHTQDEIIDLDQVQLQGATAAADSDAEVSLSVCTRALLVTRCCVTQQQYRAWLAGCGRHGTIEHNNLGHKGSAVLVVVLPLSWDHTNEHSTPLVPQRVLVVPVARMVDSVFSRTQTRNARQEAIQRTHPHCVLQSPVT